MRNYQFIPEAAADAEPELLQERYSALQRQTPWLYGILLANVLGLHFADGGVFDPLGDPVMILVAVAVARLVHWVRTRSRSLSPGEIRTQLRRTWVLALLFSAGFCLWGMSLFFRPGADADIQHYVILFGSLASIGCAYGLSSFPSAGKLPLLLLTLPLAVALLVTGDAAHAGMAVSLMLIAMAALRLLSLHDWGFSQLVRSRSEVEVERGRAREAERVALEEKARVKQVADTDPLTGLANRRAFLAALGGALASEEPVAVALIDLDGFKPINDIFGHAAGDAVLVEVSARICRAAGRGSFAARMGGDEFALLFTGMSGGAALRRIQKVSRVLQETYCIDEREYRLSGCCGLTVHRPGDGTLSEALKHADLALYQAKQQGSGEVALFNAAMETCNARRAIIERALRDEDVQEQVELEYQPIFDLEHMRLRSFEALARWSHPELGAVSPAEFIPITEQINVVEAIGYKLLRKAAAQAAAWPDSIRLSFNLSAVQLCAVSSSDRLLRVLAEHRLDPRRVQFEVTETSLLANFEAARRNLDALRAAGARVALDDFGAGFASISYLREIRFDMIKLDGSLIRFAPDDSAAFRLLRGVVELCGSMGVPCVAEHVESAVHIDLIRSLGCRYGQGYGLGVPLAAPAAAAFARAAAPAGTPLTRAA